MKRLDKLFNYLKELFIKNQSFILFSLIVLGIPILLSDVPYVNLIYTFERGIILYIVLLFVFVRPSMDFLMRFAIMLTFLSIIFLLAGFSAIAEQIGNFIFFLLVIRIVSLLIILLKIYK